MRTSQRRHFVWLIALLASVGLVAAACGSDSESTSTATTSAGEAESGIDFASLSGNLPGSGATFPQSFYDEVIAEWESNYGTSLNVTYGGGGSGKGKTDLADGVTQWAGSDSLVSDEQKATFKRPFLYFPTVAAPITVSYNLDGVEGLKLSQTTLAGIFMGQITTWNAPEIAADNAGLTLPSTAITVAVRSDGSGTTSNFSKFLKKAAPDVFTVSAGDTVQWPSAQAAQGNAGVAQLVKATPGAVGYVDFSDANETGLSLAAIENADGEFVEASLEGATAALDGVTVNADLTYDPLNATGAEAYPITAPTFVLVYATYPDQTSVDNIKGWLTFVLTDGEKLANAVDFANLPASLQAKALAQVDTITVG